MRLKRIIRKIKSFKWVLSGKAKVSFSQFGEDVIIWSLLDRCKIDKISYLDIGANAPVMGSNTYSLYTRGFNGVLIEPNPYLYQRLKSARPRDIVINTGISNENQTEADYYMFDDEYNPLNTFSYEDAQSCEAQGIPVKQKIRMPLKNINEVLTEHFKAPPTLVSLDVEGLDEQILKALDFKNFAPFIICVETMIFKKEGEMQKKHEILSFMESMGYFIYADTHVNTIFCNQLLYKSYLSNKKEP